MGGWARGAHVLLVSRCAAPRAALLLRLIFAACVCARASVPKLRDTESDTRRAAGAEEWSLAGALGVHRRREGGRRCWRRGSGNPAALWTSAASNSPPATRLKALFCSFDGASPEKSSGLCEHHARREMPAVRRSMHRY